ncbi:alginate lyase family protein [Pseudoalteromonas sp. SWXJZ94C]|uniref:heparinase II/III family protein n=1 Tax=Pseudoalteromonas sp. SWXJZ94C TaxID=2792065 RepID=UPI0018CE7E17|nr:heparinase II/III-family protein [Pseudoalteromonas sp. SWXJZ94C]MBH0057934.1 alginate lyase family protein [Pseudoalteromonas sp. SWXJZ94C]
MSLVKVKTALDLGLSNLTRVFIYQLGIKTGLNKVKSIKSEIKQGSFFTPYVGSIIHSQCNTQWFDQHVYFGFEKASLKVPNWHQSCLNSELAPSDKPWYLIDDFNNQLGDIKGVWEASRFDWIVGFAQQVVSGDKNTLTKLNFWVTDWIENNPTYSGVNWKCGQEASIRVMHLALAALLLKQTQNTTPALLSLVKAHLKRISPTIMYAVAQDNNHGTSEAAALYIGGSWLVLNGDNDGAKWQKQGLKWLENRANKLIEIDGSFSQYSVNYHRVMLDTYSLTEAWRLKHSLPHFSKLLYVKLEAATKWLFYFTDSKTGDTPNLGANDGARLIPLTNTDYRDFRPSVQLASTLFANKLVYNFSGDFNVPLEWLELKKPSQCVARKVAKDFGDGGYAYLNTTNAALYFNYPMFKFRPSQCDALHIDFWLNDQNVFRDGGTFSYNAGQKYIDYYGGVKSHNTIEFDSHDQMPRLSRFLLGDWLKTTIKKELAFSGSAQQISAGYEDRFGCKHTRAISLEPNFLTIEDIVSGFKQKAVLRFRLIPVDWKLVGSSLVSEFCTINISANISIMRIELTTGFESRYYHQESEIPVLEIEVAEPGTLTTEVKF